MSRLIVIGDSYSEPPKDQNPRVWYQQVADQLDLKLVNLSMSGVSQDWCLWQLQQLFSAGGISQGDQLILVLTHPSRYWYLERLPDLSNSWITDLDQWCSKEEATAISLFIRHIQRPSLDTIQLINRLGWLAYQSQKISVKPLIIPAFDQTVGECRDYAELIWAEGSLMSDLQYWEFTDPHDQQQSDYFFGMDCRYNHVCLSNHDILAAKIVRCFTEGAPVDLAEGFLRGLLVDQGIWDDQFCQKELCWDRVVSNRRFRSEKKPTVPWALRQKLHEILPRK